MPFDALRIRPCSQALTCTVSVLSGSGGGSLGEPGLHCMTGVPGVF